MQFGQGIDESGAEKFAAKVRPDLLDGEVIVLVCKCNNFKPLVDRVLLTNQRLLAANLTDGKIKYSADHGEVVAAVAEPSWAGATLTITKRDGTKASFKSMDVTDAQTVGARLNSSGVDAQPGVTSATVSGGGAAASGTQAGGHPAIGNEAEQRIFISYRRSDCQSQANGLHDGLRHRLDSSKIFMDIDSIPPGADFEEHIRQEIEQCDVVLVLIGDEWLDPRPGTGTRRIDEPNDFVRLEIESSLQSADVRVIPVLVEGARMPQRDELPESVQRLARLHAFDLSDSRWTSDIERLSVQLREFGGAQARSAKPQPAQTRPARPLRPPPPQGLASQPEAAGSGWPVEETPAEALAVPHADRRPSAGPGVLWGKRAQQASRNAMPAISGWLTPGERLVGLFKVNKVSPDLALLVVTDQRVLACASRPARYRPPVAAQWGDLDRVEISEYMHNVGLHCADGSVLKVGNLVHGADLGALVRLTSRYLPD